MEFDLDLIVDTIKQRGYTAYSIAQKVGLTEFGIKKIISGESKNPRKATLELLHNFLFDQEETAQLVVNEPFELAYTENKNGNNFMTLENGQYLMTMPLAEFNVQAGLLDHYQDIHYVKDMAKHSIIVDEPAKGKYMAFRVKGDSMDNGTADAIVPNSIVATRELQRQHWTSKLRFKDFPYWIIYTTENKMPLLKQITGHDTNTGIITCHSLNDSPEYIDFTLSLNDVQALFYVIGITKEVSTKSYY